MNYIKRQEPMIRHINRERVIERVVEKQADAQSSTPIDINALANALAQMLRTTVTSNAQSFMVVEDTFDNSKTLEKLATTMTVQRGKNESNFNNLGNEHHTKTDKTEVDRTIDLLSNLND